MALRILVIAALILELCYSLEAAHHENEVLECQSPSQTHFIAGKSIDFTVGVLDPAGLQEKGFELCFSIDGQGWGCNVFATSTRKEKNKLPKARDVLTFQVSVN